MTKHQWKTNREAFGGDDEPYSFGYSAGYHNGPICTVCGFYFCKHCNPEASETECGSPSIPGQASKLDMGFVAMESGIRASVGLSPVQQEG